jgi:hypothetical protein
MTHKRLQALVVSGDGLAIWRKEQDLFLICVEPWVLGAGDRERTL